MNTFPNENTPPRNVETPIYFVNLKCDRCGKVWRSLSRRAAINDLRTETREEVVRNIAAVTQGHHFRVSHCDGSLSEC